MSRFSTDWLSLREPFDHRARSTALTERLFAALSDRERPLRVVDLGCGHGSNLRYLAPRLPQPQQWRLIDHDPALLGWIAGQPSPVGTSLTLEERDLSDGLGDLPLDVDVVVTSALLDLVSRPWLASLANRCAGAGLPLLAALTVNGSVRFSPAHPGDADVMRWFRAHQKTSRGFGPSPGPAAADVLAGMLEDVGMVVYTDHSDWHIDAGQRQMLDEMIAGIAAAARECSPRPADVDRWLAERSAAVAAGAVSLVVGHLDLLALSRPAISSPAHQAGG
ncbi:MAG: SAM-dependent methyltransferase [Myxococcota bacterium]|jgi:SAM-dependent methyltransferase